MHPKTSIYTRFLSVVVGCFLVASLFSVCTFAREREFTLSSPYWDIEYDRAGYVDITNWYLSPQFHEFGPHEMMTGDFSAAVSFSGLNETNTAEWLTDRFVIPSFSTGSPFNFGTYNVSNDPCNPVWEDDTNQPSNPPYSYIQNDAGWSKVDNGKLEVTIYYEVVDLTFGDPNTNTARSPMSFVDDNESFYVNSERYVILQTYVFRNMQATENITNLEFYQMLHGHPANAYSNLAGSYNTIAIPDCLENYEPFDSVHCAPSSNTVGNFRYDMTQWNITTGAHQDYLTFSSTVATDDVGIEEFQYSSSAMRDDIENRDLNGRTSWENNDMAGAMMWNLPDLEPNQTTSITLALMYGCGEHYDSGLWVDKSDNIDPNGLTCVNPASSDPNDYKIVYTINYGNDGNEPVYNCVLTDTLPVEVDYPVDITFDENLNVISSDPNYNPENNTYVWDIGTLQPDESGSVTLTVYANLNAEPGGEFTNQAILTSDSGWVKDTETTPVCCYEEEEMVYVNKYATGAETGTSWENAYTDLQDALDRIRTCGATEIWVARGIYKPDRETASQTTAFELVSGVPIYGGFDGTETSRSERDFIQNQTILSGDISTGSNDSQKIVTMDTCDSDTVLDGFIITGGLSGIYAESGAPVITNCIIADNAGDGITCKNSDMTVSWSIIKNNTGTGADGIYIEGSTSNPTVFNCKIRDNEAHGIHVLYGVPVIKNSWIHHNDCGIYLNTPSSAATIRGNTICDNYQEGIKRIYGTAQTAPAISDCIVWGNDNDGTQITGGTTTYSCVYDPNTASSTPDADGNITADPVFAYADPNFNNYHLDPDSPCENKGNAGGTYTGEKDIDNEDRVYDSRVDMGADEITCDSVYNECDWTGDEIVNMNDFCIFSAAWLTHDPNEPGLGDPNLAVGWNPICDLDAAGDSEYVIDLADFEIFCENWLWQPCYKTSQEGTLMMLESLGGNDGQVENMAMAAELSIDTFQKVQVLQARQRRSQMAAEKTAVSTVSAQSIVEEKSVAEQILDLESAIKFLEQIWMEDDGIQQEIDSDAWQKFIDSVYQSLLDLQTQENSEP